MARADDYVKFKRMYKQHMELLKRSEPERGGFSDDLEQIAPSDREMLRDSLGVRIKPTQDTLDVMRGKYRKRIK